MKICSFRTKNRLFGVDILDVKEVTAEKVFTRIPHAPSTMKGYLSIRGHIHLIFDLSLRLGYGPSEDHPAQKIILFEPKVGPDFGILVDSMGGVIEVPDAEISDRRSQAGGQEKQDRRTHSFGLGVSSVEEGLLIILDSRKLLGS